MADIPITNNIRKVIFENFNEHDLRFNNDQIFAFLQELTSNSFQNSLDLLPKGINILTGLPLF